MATNRPISDVNRYDKDGKPRCVVTFADGTKAGLRDLSRPEMIAAAKLAHPDVPGNAWMRMSSEQVDRLVRDTDAEAVKAQALELGKLKPKGHDGDGRELGELPKVATPKPVPAESVPEAKPQAPESTDEVSDALSKLVGALSPKVDVDKLRAEITEAVRTDIDSRLREMDNVPVRVTLVMPDKERELPKLHHHLLPEISQVIAAGVHTFLSGPAGSGKSTIVEQASAALDRTFLSMSCEPSMTRSSIFGFIDAGGTYHRTPFRDWYETDEAVICIDEADNGHPSILTGMNQALANQVLAFPDGMVKRGARNVAVCTANTWGLGATAEYVGRNPLDAAFLDRFTARFAVDYDPKMERAAALQYATDDTHAAVSEWIDTVQSIRRKASEAKVRVLVTPRASIGGAMMIASGMAPKRVAEVTVYAGLTPDVLAKVKV